MADGLLPVGIWCPRLRFDQLFLGFSPIVNQRKYLVSKRKTAMPVDSPRIDNKNDGQHTLIQFVEILASFHLQWQSMCIFLGTHVSNGYVLRQKEKRSNMRAPCNLS